MLRSMPIPRLCLAIALLLGMPLAHAQYSWIDAKGVRHFSDRPPPPDTPPHRILKAPGRAMPAPAQAPAATTPAAGSAPKPLPTLAERERAYLERTKLRAEQEKQEALEAQRRRDLAEHCDIARQMKAQAESDVRVTKFNASGERVFVTDEEKAADAARANKALAQCP